MNRREFIFSAGAASFVTGCRTSEFFGTPELRFGVVSDIHVTTPQSCALFERSLRIFKRRGVHAVVVPGDLTDWGLRVSLGYVRDAWRRVFAGTDVVPLFCSGNHDYDGWWYEDMAMEMHANGYDESDRMGKDGIASAWQEVFGTRFEPVRCRSVCGYAFVSCEYGARNGRDLVAWMEKNSARLKSDKPFFYFQHMPIAGTTADSPEETTGDVVRATLDGFPNCIAFTGHAHRPFVDERQIWQGAFTVVGMPSLSYSCLPFGCENGEDIRNGASRLAMPVLPLRRDLRGGEGLLVEVWPDQVVMERLDLEEDCEGAPEWVLPLPVGADKRYAPDIARKREPIPVFPARARIDLETRNTEDRSGHWVIVLNCEFPSAEMPLGNRVFDYEIRVVPTDGSTILTKRFFSPGYARTVRHEPARQRFWINVAELPQGRDYTIEVRARNCFAEASAPLVSQIMRGKPGLDKVVGRD